MPAVVNDLPPRMITRCRLSERTFAGCVALGEMGPKRSFAGLRSSGRPHAHAIR